MWRVRVRGRGDIKWDWTFTREADALKFARQIMQRGYVESKNGGRETRFWKIIECRVQEVE